MSQREKTVTFLVNRIVSSAAKCVVKNKTTLLPHPTPHPQKSLGHPSPLATGPDPSHCAWGLGSCV